MKLSAILVFSALLVLAVGFNNEKPNQTCFFSWCVTTK